MGKPLWRRAFDKVEGAVGPLTEELVRTPGFALSLELVQKTSTALSTRVERKTRGLWHAINLPAGTDVRSLRRQVGDLDHEVRLLRGALEGAARKQARASTQKGSGSGSRSASTTQRGTGTDPKGPRAQRAAGPQRDQGGQRSG
jgi:hypothetical protein